MITAACGARDASKKRLAAWFITATESMLLTVAVGGTFAFIHRAAERDCPINLRHAPAA
jgi:hypothetical protein